MTAFLSWLGSLLTSLFAKLVSDKRADSNSQNLGKSEGSDTTNKAISETSDAQAKNNALNRGDANDVAGRLRRRSPSVKPNDNGKDVG